MTDFKPLRESSRDGFAKGLLDSAFLDEPPRHSLRKTAVLLGVGEAAAATLAASTAAGAAPELLGAATALGGSGGAALSVSASAGGKTAVFALLKWLGAGAIVGATTAGGIDYLADSSAPAAPAAAQHPSVSSQSAASDRNESAASSPHPPAASSVQPADSPETKVEVPSTARPPSIKARASDPAALSAGAKTSPPDTPALDGEIRRLDRARAALARGSSESALAELTAYERERKTTVLDREATVLRIDAMLGQGDREGARALAQRYVTAHPGDPHARRLRALLEPEPER